MSPPAESVSALAPLAGAGGLPADPRIPDGIGCSVLAGMTLHASIEVGGRVRRAFEKPPAAAAAVASAALPP